MTDQPHETDDIQTSQSARDAELGLETPEEDATEQRTDPVQVGPVRASAADVQAFESGEADAADVEEQTRPVPETQDDRPGRA